MLLDCCRVGRAHRVKAVRIPINTESRRGDSNSRPLHYEGCLTELNALIGTYTNAVGINFSKHFRDLIAVGMSLHKLPRVVGLLLCRDRQAVTRRNTALLDGENQSAGYGGCDCTNQRLFGGKSAPIAVPPSPSESAVDLRGLLSLEPHTNDGLLTAEDFAKISEFLLNKKSRVVARPQTSRSKSKGINAD